MGKKSSGSLLGPLFFGVVLVLVLGMLIQGLVYQMRPYIKKELVSRKNHGKVMASPDPAPEFEAELTQEPWVEHELAKRWTIARIEGQDVVVEEPRGRKYSAALCADGMVRALTFDRSVEVDDPDASASSTIEKRFGDHYNIQTKRSLRGVCLLFDDINVAETRTIFPASDAPDECIDPGISRQSCQEKILRVCDPKLAPRYVTVGKTQGKEAEELRFCLHQKVNEKLATSFALVRQGNRCRGFSTLSVGDKVYDLGTQWQGDFAADDGGHERCVFSGGEYAVDELTLSSRVLPAQAIARVFQWRDREFVLTENPSQEGNRYRLLELAASGPEPILAFYDYHFGGYSW